MPNASADERTTYVEGLYLPEIDPHLVTKGLVATTQEDNKKSGSINAGNLVSFTANLTGRDKYDVLHSVLLAQLVADNKNNRNDKPIEWYNDYFKVLTNVGWVVQGEPFAPYNASGSTVTIEKTVIELLSAIASGQMVLIVKQVLESLRNLSENDRGFVIWDRSTHSKKNGNFQLSGVTKDNTSIALSAVNLYFSANQTDTKFLWFSYSTTQVSLNYRNSSLTLNQEIYSTVRDKIKEKLGNRTHAYVENLEIPPEDI
jgi:hypothetical protein